MVRGNILLSFRAREQVPLESLEHIAEPISIAPAHSRPC